MIEQHPGSIIIYGSELRPLHKLEPLLKHHPTYEKSAINHVVGIYYPLKKINKGTQKSNLDKTIKRGNHKSALSKIERPYVTKLMKQDVELGKEIPLTLECIQNLKDEEI